MAKILQHQSYWPMSRAYNCLKLIPKMYYNKKFHNRKARQTRKNFLRKEVDETV